MDPSYDNDVYAMIRAIAKPDLIEDTQENLDKVVSLLQLFFEQKITRSDLEVQFKELLRSTDLLTKLDTMVQTQLAATAKFSEANQKLTRQGRQKSSPWTPEEDERLSKAINEHGTNNWGAVANFVGNNRTRAQCSQRWNRVINPNISKANWSKEEEEKLLSIVQQLGNKAWTRVAAQFGNRSDVQCRFKYNYLIKKQHEMEYQPYIQVPTLEIPKEEEKEDIEKKEEDMKLE